MRYIPYSYLSIAKRCKNGYHKNPKTGQCEPKNQKGTSNTSSGCLEGFHQHAGYKNCHEIWKPHKPHTLSCNQHRLLGIPCRYKGEKLDADGRPVDKGIPTRAWLKQAKEKKEKKKKEQKDDKPKEEPIVGLPKHQVVNKTRNMMMDICKRIEGFEAMSNSVNDVFDKFDESDEEYSGANLLKKAFNKETMPWFNEITLNGINKEVVDLCIPDIKKTVSEYPLALMMFTKLGGDKTDDSIAYCNLTGSNKGRIMYGKYFYNPEGRAYNRQQYQKLYDPITKEMTDWGFHHQGSNYFDSFSHEYGHLMMRIFGEITAQFEVAESRESTEHRKDAWFEENNEMYEWFKENCPSDFIGRYPSKNDTIPYNLGKGFSFFIKDGETTRDDVKAFTSKFKKYLKEKGYKVKVEDESSGVNYSIKPIDSEVQSKPWHPSQRKLTDVYYADRKSVETPVQFREYFLYTNESDNGVIFANIYTDFIDEVEEIYKEMYNVDKIIPSDVYSGYGYLGNNKQWNWKMPKKRTVRLNAHERVAEAFSDVVVRGDKANSMSSLLVAGIQYYISARFKGEEKTFTEYMRENYTPETIGERIIKHRYINP